jgi:hypothetical protein
MQARCSGEQVPSITDQEMGGHEARPWIMKNCVFRGFQGHFGDHAGKLRVRGRDFKGEIGSEPSP